MEMGYGSYVPILYKRHTISAVANAQWAHRESMGNSVGRSYRMRENLD